jgi:O-antigen ligase
MAFRKSNNVPKPWSFWIMCAFLVLAFLTGGSSRADVQSLVILRPVAVLICFYAAWHLRFEDITNNKFLIGFAAACFLLAGLHLVPLPPTVWQALPGRGLMAEIDNQVGLGQIWRPMTLDPVSGWNALYSLFVPLAVLLLGLTLKRDDIYRLLPVVIGIGLITGLVGLIQAASGENSAVNLYRISNKGNAVGLFANRNHQAVFLATMFPMLAAYACAGIKTAEQARFRLWISIAAGLVLIPLLLATGSRAGLITGFIGLISVLILYRTPQTLIATKRKVAKRRYYYIAAAFASVAVGLLAILFSRATAIDRLFADNIVEDTRGKIFSPALEMAWSYFPFGSGMGSFATAFKIDEPNATLSPQFINRAHNDYLELYMTGGLPALLILMCTISALGLTAYKLWISRKNTSKYLIIARASIIVAVIFIIASMGDYPLRMPSLMCFTVILALWIKHSEETDNLESQSLTNDTAFI